MKKIRKLINIDLLDYKSLEIFLNQQAKNGYHLIKGNRFMLTFEYHTDWERYYSVIVNRSYASPFNINHNHQQHILSDLIDSFEFEKIARINGMDLYVHHQPRIVTTDETLEQQQVNAILNTHRRSGYFSFIVSIIIIVLYLSSSYQFLTQGSAQTLVAVYFYNLLKVFMSLYHYRKFKKGTYTSPKRKWKSLHSDFFTILSYVIPFLFIILILYQLPSSIRIKFMIPFMPLLFIFFACILMIQNYLADTKLTKAKRNFFIALGVISMIFVIVALPRTLIASTLSNEAQYQYPLIFTAELDNYTSYHSPSLIIEKTTYYNDNHSIEVFHLMLPFGHDYLVQEIVKGRWFELSLTEGEVATVTRYDSQYFLYYSGPYVVITDFELTPQQLTQIDNLN